ncbi:DUF6924 domain-containing protein [Micrococcus terreus]|uniref:DUF6924 domain-containing protein n=1 Tax=Micrococcus terreus TaxID=574650 RepID=UPI003AFB54A0
MQDRTFRSLPPEVEPIAANRALTTMDFFEFADAGDSDGVFWGFPDRALEPAPCRHRRSARIQSRQHSGRGGLRV